MKKRHVRKEITKQNLLEKGGKQKQITPAVRHEENITNTTVGNEEDITTQPKEVIPKKSIALELSTVIIGGFIVNSIYNGLGEITSWLTFAGLSVSYCAITQYRRDGIKPFAKIARQGYSFLKRNLFKTVKILSLIIFLIVFSIFTLR